jgi:hypothetical protein
MIKQIKVMALLFMVDASLLIVLCSSKHSIFDSRRIRSASKYGNYIAFDDSIYILQARAQEQGLQRTAAQVDLPSNFARHSFSSFKQGFFKYVSNSVPYIARTHVSPLITFNAVLNIYQ